LVNFWRCLAQGRAAEVAEYADSPVFEADLHARHRWLVRSDESHGWRFQFSRDPEYCDPKIAGWWVWGQCCWIGGAWCHDDYVGRNAMPQVDVRHGGHRAARDEQEPRPQLWNGGPTGWGVNSNPPSADVEQVPELSSGVGRGIAAAHTKRVAEGNTRGVTGGRPQLADAFDIGRGVNGNGSRRLCDVRRAWLIEWMNRLADRLRLVRTCYGHWSRICDSDSTLIRLGLTGVFIDPPYPTYSELSGKKSRDGSLYATDKHSDLNALRDEVRDWCIRWGSSPMIRAAVCCYEGDGYEALAELAWECFEWETAGGYANQRRGGQGKAENAKRERIWFSPACLKAHTEPTLFDGFKED
jgi:hypothetical protein